MQTLNTKYSSINIDVQLRLGKLQHNQTLMPEILRWVPEGKRYDFLFSLVRKSRGYLVKYWALLHKKEGPEHSDFRWLIETDPDEAMNHRNFRELDFLKVNANKE